MGRTGRGDSDRHLFHGLEEVFDQSAGVPHRLIHREAEPGVVGVDPLVLVAAAARFEVPVAGGELLGEAVHGRLMAAAAALFVLHKAHHAGSTAVWGGVLNPARGDLDETPAPAEDGPRFCRDYPQSPSGAATLGELVGDKEPELRGRFCRQTFPDLFGDAKECFLLIHDGGGG